MALSSQTKETILVADDEASIRRILETRLSMIGYKVVTASDGKEALKLFKDYDPDEIWSNAVEKIVKFIKNGESVVLLCLGDTSIFASSSNILRIIKHNYPEIITKTIPGISSISAAAALNDFDLVKKGETLIIKECPSSESELTTLIRESKENKTVLAIMKVGKRWNLVREILKKEDIIDTTLIALSVGMPDQIIQYASQYKKEFMPYFSLILIRFD